MKKRIENGKEEEQEDDLEQSKNVIKSGYLSRYRPCSASSLHRLALKLANSTGNRQASRGQSRYFELTKEALLGFEEVSNRTLSSCSKRRKLKLRLNLSHVVAIEEARLNSQCSTSGFMLQIQTERDALYLQTEDKGAREEWLEALRLVILSHHAGNRSKWRSHFHPEVAVTPNTWSCCNSAKGCTPTLDIWASRKLENLLKLQASPAPSAKASHVDVNDDLNDDDINDDNDEINNNDNDVVDDDDDTENEGKNGENGRVVLAVYAFNAIETGDLSLKKGMEYVVLDDSQEHWWLVREKDGQSGYVPSNYVRYKEDNLNLSSYEWYVGEMGRQRAESLLREENKDGCFVVRNSSTKGMYTLSLFTKLPQAQVKHYHIKENKELKQFYLSEKHCCKSIPELVEYHSYNGGGLACRLRCSLSSSGGVRRSVSSNGKWEIDPTELTLLEELGSGQFGVVRRGKWKNGLEVAVKLMKEGTMSEDDFIEEAKLMTRLQHVNLVQLYGVCSKNRPIFIVTEYMKHGSLLHFLRSSKTVLASDVAALLDISLQVCRGMAYLERHNYIHRDLAARNCLVGNDNVIKVGDFGLARYVIDDQYTSNGGAKFPIKWSPPEVLNYTRFSSKSDVWAFGILMWEVFSCGDTPYGRAKNPEVVERVQRGHVLNRPTPCPENVYLHILMPCWQQRPEDRPPFRRIKETITEHILTLQ